MEHLTTLHDEYQAMSRRSGMFQKVVPDHIAGNLAHGLRPYQTEAINRWMYYMDEDQARTVPVQLLFHMATGSGKTLVMAALLLDLYRRGRRNFIFFVNSTTIIDKTRANFLDRGVAKYLFAGQILVEGQLIPVRQVDNFSQSRDDAINIVFTTIQGLHGDLNNPHENRLTYEELAGHDLVLLSDEAHHLNANTTRAASKREQELDTSWERTVQNIMAANPRNILLEFTATIDTEDAAIMAKYAPRLLYQYDLRAFRQDGFSKDVLIYEVDSDLTDRALQAIIISQYRKKVALAAGIWCKPVVLFKSNTKADSAVFFDQFKQLIAGLEASTIVGQRPRAGRSDILAQAFDYFDKSRISEADLAYELRADFSPERLMLIDSDNKATVSQLALNSLEERSNEIRAIFSVDMLDEGWDVLNLFDIVRLYDKRDGKNGRPGKTTMREAQLIGRGARYFPFSRTADGEDRYVRKFDHNELEPLRAIEQLHYHSAHNPRYIQELTYALKETGIVGDDLVERNLRLKESFKQTDAYRHGVIWRNRRLDREQAIRARQIRLIPDEYDLPDEVFVTLPSGLGQEISIFGAGGLSTIAAISDPADGVVREQAVRRLRLTELPPSVVRTAVARDKHFTFERVASAFFGVRSLDDFMFGATLLGSVDVVLTGEATAIWYLNPDQALFVAAEVLRAVEQRIERVSREFVGSRQFEQVPLSQVFGDVRRKFDLSPSGDGETGRPQLHSPRYALDLRQRDWYAYDEDYGSSEEKSLVRLIDGLIDRLRCKWHDIYLIRNESAVRLYSFEDGQAFEPDYLLIAQSSNGRGVQAGGSINWQLFIEPKGDQFLGANGGFDGGKEAWKQRLLAEVNRSPQSEVIAEDRHYRIVGLPFYNEAHTAADFRQAIDTL